MKALHRLSPGQMLSVIAATFFSSFLLVLVIPDNFPANRYFRFQQLADTIHYQARWIYERLHYDPTPVDIIIVGGSGTLYGLNAPLLEKELAGRGLPNVHVVNLSLVHFGYDLGAFFTRDAIEAKHPKLVIVLALEKLPRLGHELFKELADVHDIVRAPVFVNFHYFDDLMRVSYRQIKLAAVALDPKFFGYDSSLDWGRYAGPEVDTTSGDERLPDGHVLHHDVVHSREFIEEDKVDADKHDHPSLFGLRLLPYEFAVSYNGLKEIASIAKAGHAALLIYYEGHYGGPKKPIDYDFLRSQAPVIIGDWLPDSYEFFTDSRHLNSAGAKVNTAGLANAIAQNWRSLLLSER